jgi:hypothetical protein
MDEIDAPRSRHLQDVLDALAPAHGITSLTRLRGGTKKGVYRAALDGRSVIVYVWDESENYWPVADTGVTDDPADPFADASGADLFAVSHQCLQSLGVRTPELYLLDTSRAAFPAEIAVVEDITGGSLLEHQQHSPNDAARIAAELGEMLRAMHARRNPRFGKLISIDNHAPQEVRPEQRALHRALGHLDHAAGQIGRLRDVQDQLAATLRSMAAGIQPRSEYGLIHGELGPDHVLVDEHGHPVIIDIEGLMFFDIEWEHAFLRFRFDEYYHYLSEEGLDPARLSFYQLCLHLSLCSGPLRLLEGNFPERDQMMDILNWNIAQVLASKMTQRQPHTDPHG